ncbi:hypothetical protein WDW37_06340 [Bdellovibrionota bacterium FG-1]
MNVKTLLKQLWRDDRGQSTTEYILILSVVVMIAMKFKTSIGKKIEGMVDKVSGEIDTGMSNN